jgi:hypothetical protein
MQLRAERDGQRDKNIRFEKGHQLGQEGKGNERKCRIVFPHPKLANLVNMSQASRRP